MADLVWIPHITASATLLCTTRAKLLIRLIQVAADRRVCILLQLPVCTREFFASALKARVYSLRRNAEHGALPSTFSTDSKLIRDLIPTTPWIPWPTPRNPPCPAWH